MPLQSQQWISKWRLHTLFLTELFSRAPVNIWRKVMIKKKAIEYRQEGDIVEEIEPEDVRGAEQEQVVQQSQGDQRAIHRGYQSQRAYTGPFMFSREPERTHAIANHNR